MKHEQTETLTFKVGDRVSFRAHGQAVVGTVTREISKGLWTARYSYNDRGKMAEATGAIDGRNATLLPSETGETE